MSVAASNATTSLGLPASAATQTESPTQRVAALGKRLFFDKRLSADGSVSCALCHIPEKAFTDGLPVARGIHQQSGTRNTPSLWNVTFATSEFWDGRRPSLEQQAADPLLNPREHGLPDAAALLAIVRSDEEYRQGFQVAFGTGPRAITLSAIVTSLAAYERTLVAGGAPFDRYVYGHDRTALSSAAVRGLRLFQGRAQCATCHLVGDKTALFTDNLYHSLGVGMRELQPRLAAAAARVVNASAATLDRLIGADADIAALGRFVVTRQPRDIGMFKTPSLRNVAATAPYMHDGSVATLTGALDTELYYRGLETGTALILTPREKRDLLEFLRSLTSPATASPNALP